jgi:hypothetical protein
MKKALSWVIICIFMVLLIGCSNERKEKDPNEETNGFEIKAALNIVNNYMKYLMDEDYENAVTMYTKELREKTKNITSSSLKIRGYKVDEINEVGRNGLFKIKITRSDNKRTLAVLDKYTIKVIKDGVNYRIDEIKSEIEKEAFFEGAGIRLRDKNNVKTNLVIDISSVPKYTFSEDDAANISEKVVPRDNFGSINFGYEGDKLCISTYDKNAFIGIVNIDESLAVQGNGGEQKEGKGKSEGGSNVIIKEKPIGKNIVSLDLLENAKVDFMSFSLDEKFVVVQYNKEGLGKCIRIYKTDNGEMIPINIEKEYPLSKVEIIFSSFDKEVINFEVIPKENIENPQVGLIGKWQMDLKEFKIKKL